MKSAGKARNNGLYRHIRTSKEIIRNLLNDYCKNKISRVDLTIMARLCEFLKCDISDLLEFKEGEEKGED